MELLRERLAHPNVIRMTFEAMADTERELREALRNTEADRDSYKLLAYTAIESLATVTAERDQARRTIRELREVRRAERLAA